MSDKMINFYEQKKVQKFMPKSHNPYYKEHGIKLPVRGALIGSSGSGKSNFLLNIISQMRNTFNKIFIYTQAEEPLYNYLKSQIDDDLLTISYNLEDCVNYNEENYYGQTLIIFDDCCVLKNQDIIKTLYIRGRKIAGGISLLYLSQSYYKIPKLVRLQCQYVWVIKVSGMRDLNMMLSEYSLGATKEQLMAMYNYCCNNGDFGNSLLIDLNAAQSKTYRKNFKEYLNPKDFN